MGEVIGQVLPLAIAVALSPLAIVAATGDRSKQFLDTLRHWMVQSTARVTATLGMIVGVKLVGDPIDSRWV